MRGAARDVVSCSSSPAAKRSAFEAVIYEALHEHGLQPDWIVDASLAVGGLSQAPNRSALSLL